MGIHALSGVSQHRAAVQFKGTVRRDAAPHFIIFPGHSEVFQAFEKRVKIQLKPETHLDLTSSTYRTSGGRRQEHYVTVTHAGQVVTDKAYIGAWGADEDRRSGWDALAWIPGKIGRWAENKKDQQWYAAQLDRAFKIAQQAEKKHRPSRLEGAELVSC